MELGGGFYCEASLYEAHFQTKELVDLSDPLAVTLGEVVIDCHNVQALASEGVQVGG